MQTFHQEEMYARGINVFSQEKNIFKQFKEKDLVCSGTHQEKILNFLQISKWVFFNPNDVSREHLKKINPL